MTKLCVKCLVSMDSIQDMERSDMQHIIQTIREVCALLSGAAERMDNKTFI